MGRSGITAEAGRAWSKKFRKIISFLIFWEIETERQQCISLCPGNHMSLSFGLDIVMKSVFFIGKIYRKVTFVLNNFKIVIYIFFLIFCFVFTLLKK